MAACSGRCRRDRRGPPGAHVVDAPRPIARHPRRDAADDRRRLPAPPGPRPRADDVWVAIGTDVVFRVPAIALAEASGAHAATRMYLFTHRSTASRRGCWARPTPRRSPSCSTTSTSAGVEHDARRRHRRAAAGSPPHGRRLGRLRHRRRPVAVARWPTGRPTTPTDAADDAARPRAARSSTTPRRRRADGLDRAERRAADASGPSPARSSRPTTACCWCGTVRRNGSSDWTPPGGVIEVADGESVLDGLTREVAEETGLT